MAIVSFWSDSKKETGQTLSIVSLATYMGVVENKKILLVNGCFNDDSLERCFWKITQKKTIGERLNKGKLDIGSGAEGLVSAVASNKTTPEIISNFTRAILRGRLDVLPGLKTTSKTEFTKSMMLYKDLLKTADKYYELVFVDCEKSMDDDTTKTILENSNIIYYTMSQNIKQRDEYLIARAKYKDILKKEKTIPLLGCADEASVMNVKNFGSTINDRNMPQVLYNPGLKDSASNAQVPNFFMKNSFTRVSNDKNSKFISNMAKLLQTLENTERELGLIV